MKEKLEKAARELANNLSLDLKDHINSTLWIERAEKMIYQDALRICEEELLSFYKWLTNIEKPYDLDDEGMVNDYLERSKK